MLAHWTKMLQTSLTVEDRIKEIPGDLYVSVCADVQD